MEALQKPFKTVDEQIQILQARGLQFRDLNDAQKKLLNNNYYTIINGYKYPFLVHDTDLRDEQYKIGASFDEVFALYSFDCQIRALFLKYILQVEHQLKSVISHTFAAKYKDIPYPQYLSEEFFGLEEKKRSKKAVYNDLILHITAELKHQIDNNNKMIKHYLDNYNNIPPWILMSVLSFGMMRSFYDCLKNQDQNEIGRRFGLQPDEMLAYLAALNMFRNACAHNERIYNMRLNNQAKRKNKQYSTIYVIILILKDILNADTFMSFYSSLDAYIRELSNNLSTISINDILHIMGIPVDPEVQRIELGELNKGNALSQQEFQSILEHYIFPMLPVSSNLTPTPVPTDDPDRFNRKCNLVEVIGKRVYFAQSTNEAFQFFITLPDSFLNNLQIDIVKEHLAVLIDYIHVFWNLSKTTAYGRDKVKLAFPNLCEQAYQLSICSVMCNSERIIAAKKRDDQTATYKKLEGSLSRADRREWIERLQQIEAEYITTLKIESIAQQTLYKTINQIELWARKTYEGQRKAFGIIICKNQLPTSNPLFDYVDFLKTDFSATINDGQYSAVEIYSDGTFKAHIPISPLQSSDMPFIPFPFMGFADLCSQDKIGVLLTTSGDTMLISGRKLCYTKHNGYWLRCNSDKTLDLLKHELDKADYEVVLALSQTIADVSHSHGGACIGIINDGSIPDRLSTMIESGLLSSPELDKKRIALKGLISDYNSTQPRSFSELDRNLRRELLELDGAMVISKSGKIHVIGTIIKLNTSGSDGGGRTAAAMELSEFGLAVKISQDGYVQFYKDREMILEMLS